MLGSLVPIAGATCYTVSAEWDGLAYRFAVGSLRFPSVDAGVRVASGANQ